MENEELSPMAIADNPENDPAASLFHPQEEVKASVKTKAASSSATSFLDDLATGKIPSSTGKTESQAAKTVDPL